MPLEVCSVRSSHTVLPLQLHTVLSLSQTPALLAMTPTSVSGSSLSNCSVFLLTTILRPIISQICIGLSKKTEPSPLFPTSIVPNSPFAVLEGCSFFASRRSQMPPVVAAPSLMLPDSRTVTLYVPGVTPRSVMSRTVMDGPTCTMRMRPRTWSFTVEECVSRMQTAALSPLPEPRRIASRPVS
jgi:hypothetical protein